MVGGRDTPMVKATGQGGCTIDEETTRGVDQPEGDSICFVSDAFPESAGLGHLRPPAAEAADW